MAEMIAPCASTAGGGPRLPAIAVCSENDGHGRTTMLVRSCGADRYDNPSYLLGGRLGASRAVAWLARDTWYTAFVHANTLGNSAWSGPFPTQPPPTIRTSPMPTRRGCANGRVGLLAADFLPLPVGVPGECLAGGDGLARGYRGRPALTGEHFVPNRLARRPGGRLYHTGNRVLRRTDGGLEFLGRMDQQVKLRCFRVESRGVETGLEAHPKVAQAAVVLVRSSERGRKLVACVVAPAQFEPMVLAAVVFVDELALTTNGEFDRRALVEPVAGEDRATSAPYVALSTSAEELLAGISADVRVGDFYDGNVVNVNLYGFIQLATLFSTPTVPEITSTAEAARQRQTPTQPIRPAGRAGGVPHSLAKQLLSFLDRLHPVKLAYQVPAFLVSTGPLAPAVLAVALAAAGRRREALRTVCAEVGGWPVQGFRPSAALSLPLVDLLALVGGLGEAEVEPRRLVAREAARRFDSAGGRLLLARLVRPGAACWLNVATGDVLAPFAVSRAADLQAVAGHCAANAHAWWQGDRPHRDAMEALLAHWRRQFAGLPPHVGLQAAERLRNEVFSLRLSGVLAGVAAALARCQGVTLPVTLLIDRLDLGVGMLISVSNKVEVETPIGFFVNNNDLVLRVDPLAAFGLAALLTQAQEAAVDDDDLAPERDLGGLPHFHVTFALESAGCRRERPAVAAGLGVSRLGVAPATALYDLAVLEPGRLPWGERTFATDLVGRWNVGHFVSHFAVHLADLPLLTAAEHHRRLAEWGRRVAPPCAGGGRADGAWLPQLGAELARRTRGVPAVYYNGVGFACGEFRTPARDRVHRLCALGEAAEARVGPVFGSYPEAIVLALAFEVAPYDELFAPGSADRRTGAELSELGQWPLIARDRCAYVIYTSGLAGEGEAEDPCLPPQLVVERAPQAPGARAVYDGDDPALSYGDFDRRAAQLIHRLRALEGAAEGSVEPYPSRLPEPSVLAFGEEARQGRGLAFAGEKSYETFRPLGSTGRRTGAESIDVGQRTPIAGDQCSYATYASGMAFRKRGVEGVDGLLCDLTSRHVASSRLAGQETQSSEEALRAWLVAKGISASYPCPRRTGRAPQVVDWRHEAEQHTMLTGCEILLRRLPDGSVSLRIDRFWKTESTESGTRPVSPAQACAAPTGAVPTLIRPPMLGEGSLIPYATQRLGTVRIAGVSAPGADLARSYIAWLRPARGCVATGTVIPWLGGCQAALGTSRPHFQERSCPKHGHPGVGHSVPVSFRVRLNRVHVATAAFERARSAPFRSIERRVLRRQVRTAPPRAMKCATRWLSKSRGREIRVPRTRERSTSIRYLTLTSPGKHLRRD